MMEQQNSCDLKIKSKRDLEGYINDQILKIKELDDAGKKDESQELANNISSLSEKFNLGGMIIDPLTDEKYFVSLGRLRGGVKGFASECSEFKRENLYNKDRYVVLSHVDYLFRERYKISTILLEGAMAPPLGFMNMGALAGIVLSNRSRHTLEYCNCGSSEGYFFTGDGSAANSFAGPETTIQPGYSAGFVHTKTIGSIFGAAGYISFRIRTEIQNYVIIFGWGVYRGKRNRAGFEIRPTCGNTVEPTGAIADLKAFLTTEHHGGEASHLFKTEVIGQFKFQYTFGNDTFPEKEPYLLLIDDC